MESIQQMLANYLFLKQNSQKQGFRCRIKRQHWLQGPVGELAQPLRRLIADGFFVVGTATSDAGAESIAGDLGIKARV